MIAVPRWYPPTGAPVHCTTLVRWQRFHGDSHHCHRTKPLLAVSRILRIAAAVLTALVLAGCMCALKLPGTGTAAPPSRSAALERLRAATPCCRAWSDLPFHQPLPPEPKAFTIDEFSPVAELAGARTHFLTFVLPPFKRPFGVVFQTRPSARHLGNSFLFAPTATVLNADYKPLSSTNVALCVYINWRPSMSGGFGAITISNPDARFLVLTTSKQQLAATTYWAQSPTTFNTINVPAATALGSVTPVSPVTAGSFEVPHGPEGTLIVGRMTPAYASAVDHGLCGKPSPGAGLLPSLRHALPDR